MKKSEQKSITRGFIWMLIIATLLFWLPVIGPLLAGVVGGKKAGGLGTAIIASLLPALLLGVFLFMVSSLLTGLPVFGILAGAGGAAAALTQAGPLLAGAIVGGLLAD
ncbi:MAG: hypothetical protein ACQEQG_04695 [Bacillota bacterium]